MKLPLRMPRRRWWVHVAWVTSDGMFYRLYTGAFPWFTPCDVIARDAYRFVRQEAGQDEFIITTLTFRPNRGRNPVASYGPPA